MWPPSPALLPALRRWRGASWLARGIDLLRPSTPAWHPSWTGAAARPPPLASGGGPAPTQASNSCWRLTHIHMQHMRHAAGRGGCAARGAARPLPWAALALSVLSALHISAAVPLGGMLQHQHFSGGRLLLADDGAAAACCGLLSYLTNSTTWWVAWLPGLRVAAGPQQAACIRTAERQMILMNHAAPPPTARAAGLLPPPRPRSLLRTSRPATT